MAGNLKIQNSPTAYIINADKLVFDSGHGWKQLLLVVRISFSHRGSQLKSFPERRKCHFTDFRFQKFSGGACTPLELCVVKKQ
jgi:hypothetical protein